ncbi:MAG TPA: pyrimidine 5'-nucleotidase [Anaerolineales bacterium]
MPYFTTIFFDLDDTLYPGGNGLWDAIRGRMGRYMWERLGLPKEDVPALRRSYYKTYGTTLRGLQIHHRVDVDDYLDYVHAVPLENYLQPAPELHGMLLSLPQGKWVFTNADANHARRVITVLGIGDCFEGIIDIRANAFNCKPEAVAYQTALALAGERDPRRCVLLDDSPGNLAPARQMGFTTVLVGQTRSDPAATCSIENLLALRQALPELWNGMG